MPIVLDGTTGITSPNLGVGVALSAWNSGTKVIENESGALFSIGAGSLRLYQNAYYNSAGNNIYETTSNASAYIQTSGQHLWFNAPSGTAGNVATFTQAMTLDASGQLLLGTTSTFLTGTHSFQNYGGQEGVLTLRNSSATGTTWRIGPNSAGTMVVYNQSSVGVYLPSGSTAWIANSDERLKSDLIPIENAAEKVSTLRAVTGRYTNDEEGISRAFLIAQDVQAVLPEAVSVQDDELGTLGVAYTDIIPLLVAAIKEQQAMIDELKAKVAALEAA